MKKFNLIFLSLFLVIISCNKEEFTEVTQPQKHVSSNNEEDSPEQSEVEISELEYYAAIHNEVLEHFGQQSDLDELSFEQKYDLAADYFDNNYPGFSIPSMQDADLSENLPRTLYDIADSLFNEEIISDYAKGKIIDLETMIFNNFYVEKIQDLTDSLNVFESDINDSENLTLDEKRFIIGISVITRFSTTFWADVATSQSDYWYSIAINDNINNSLLPSAYISTYNSLDAPQSTRLIWKALYDIIMFTIWSEDCPGHPGCYEWTAFNALVASGW